VLEVFVVEDTDVVPMLRNAVGFYYDRVEELDERLEFLRAEIERVEAERSRAWEVHERLSEDLTRVLDARATDQAIDPEGRVGDDAVEEPTVVDDAGVSESDEVSAVRRTTWRGSLTQGILRVLAGSGRPMRARELNEALGREETRSRRETMRTTCKRLASRGEVVEVEPGLYRIARQGRDEEGVA
jgi:hypothetical protein